MDNKKLHEPAQPERFVQKGLRELALLQKTGDPDEGTGYTGEWKDYYTTPLDQPDGYDQSVVGAPRMTVDPVHHATTSHNPEPGKK